MCAQTEDIEKLKAKFRQNEIVVIQGRGDEAWYQDDGRRKKVKKKVRDIQKKGGTRLSNN